MAHNNDVWMFSSAKAVWINCCLLRESKRLILGDGITDVMPTAVHLHGFLLQGFVGQTVFLPFKPKVVVVRETRCACM